MNHHLEVEVFRAGDYGEKGNWSPQDLEQLAADYDPAVHEAPVTLDHAQDGPALGWVERLRCAGGALLARLRCVGDSLQELIGQETFKKRSVELYPQFHATGRPYLRAVSFLGAHVPEVKGMADPLAPAATQPALFHEENLAAPHAIELGGEDRDEAPPAPHGELEQPEPVESQATAEREESSRSTEAQSQTATPLEAGFAFGELQRQLKQDGRWRPAWNEMGIERFFESLSQRDQKPEDAPSQTFQGVQWFSEFLRSLPPVVTFGESAATSPAGALVSNDAPGLPTGGNVDAQSLSLHKATVALLTHNPALSYSQALRECAKAMS